MTAADQNDRARASGRARTTISHPQRDGAMIVGLVCAAVLTILVNLTGIGSTAVAEIPVKTQVGPLLDDLPPVDDATIRLVMVAIEGCPFCMRWQSQVGHIYPKSDEAKIAPLVRVRFGAKTLADFKKIKYTPTFLVLKGKIEIGRIAGYPGADPFWEELGDILKKNEVRQNPTPKVQP